MRKSIERTVKVSREGILVAHADSKASLLAEEEKKMEGMWYLHIYKLLPYESVLNKTSKQGPK